MIGMFARKRGMTQLFAENGDAHGVTVLEILENMIIEVKTEARDGYFSLQIGALGVEEKKLSKPEQGHFKKKDLPCFRHLREFKVPEATAAQYKAGDTLKIAELFGTAGALVDVQARPKGRGTSGRIKRWNQKRRLMTHGTKHHRQIGSIGGHTEPGRVFKGLNMPGRDNNDVSVIKLSVFEYLPEDNLLLITGSVPSFNGAIVIVQPSTPKGAWNSTALELGRRAA